MSWEDIIKNVGEHGVGDMEQYERRMLREEGQEWGGEGDNPNLAPDPEWTKLAEQIHDDYVFASYKLSSITDYVQRLLNHKDDNFSKGVLEDILKLATKKK
jgi:hypothetical protein